MEFHYVNVIVLITKLCNGNYISIMINLLYDSGIIMMELPYNNDLMYTSKITKVTLMELHFSNRIMLN